MSNIHSALKNLNFKWLPKHLNHIAENIVYKKRNISFLAINALFRQKNANIAQSETPFENSFVISGVVAVLPNDKLRLIDEKLTVIFRIDEQNNIIPITSFSESDEI